MFLGTALTTAVNKSNDLADVSPHELNPANRRQNQVRKTQPRNAHGQLEVPTASAEAPIPKIPTIAFPICAKRPCRLHSRLGARLPPNSRPPATLWPTVSREGGGISKTATSPTSLTHRNNRTPWRSVRLGAMAVETAPISPPSLYFGPGAHEGLK